MSLLRHRTVVFLLVVAALAGGWETYPRWRRPAGWRRSWPPRSPAQPRVNVAVRLGFAPEEFHIRLFQGYGVVRGVRGTTVLLDRVRGGGRRPPRPLLLGPPDRAAVTTFERAARAAPWRETDACAGDRSGERNRTGDVPAPGA